MSFLHAKVICSSSKGCLKDTEHIQMRLAGMRILHININRLCLFFQLVIMPCISCTL